MLTAPRRRLVALVLLALAVRGGFLLADPHPFQNSGLAADSAEIARQIDVHGRWFESNLVALNQLGDLQDARRRLIDPAAVDFRAADARPRLQPDVLQPVGEAVVLAALWPVTGEHWLPYQLLMIVLDSTMVLVVVFIAGRLFGRPRAALLAGLLYAIFPPIAWLATVPHLDIWAVELTVIITALLLGARDAVRPRWWLLAAGVAVGLGSYFRPGLLLIPPLVALSTLARARWRAALRLGAVPTAVAVVLVVPWTIRNEVVFHRFIPLRIGVGQNLWEGLGEKHNDFGATLDDAATFQEFHARRPDLVYGSPAYDAFLESRALHTIRAHPGFYAELVAQRLVDSTIALGNTDWAGSVVRPSQSGLGLIDYVRRRFGDLLVILLEPLLFLASALTILLTRRRYGRAHLLLVAVLVATLLPYLFLHVEPRYLLPASFGYLVITALGLDLLLERFRAAPVRSQPDVRHLRHPGDLAELRRD